MGTVVGIAFHLVPQPWVVVAVTTPGLVCAVCLTTIVWKDAGRLDHVLREVAKNTLMAVPAIRRYRAMHPRTTTDAQVQQIRDQFAFFIGTLGDVRGKTIVEIGPGDSIALGPLFLRAGAHKYIAYDRFRGDVFGPQAHSLYAALSCPEDFSAGVSLRGAIEDAKPTREADIVISFDVLEHLRDPHLALRKMVGLLKPDGVMVHRVDYSAHDIWRSYDEETFLQFPEWLWKLMGSNRGYPNRVRHKDIMATVHTLGLQSEERITRRFCSGDALIAEVSCGRYAPRLGPAFPY